MSPLYLALAADGMINTLVSVVVVGVIAWLLWWLADFSGIPAPFNRVAKAIIALVAVVILIRQLLKFTGVEF